jgi:Superinfection immunity protein
MRHLSNRAALKFGDLKLPIRCAQHQLREERIIVLASSSGGGAAPALLVVIVGIGLYFLPTIIAVARKVTNQGSVLVINFFLGWTFVGWVVALAMACRTSNLSAR